MEILMHWLMGKMASIAPVIALLELGITIAIYFTAKSAKQAARNAETAVRDNVVISNVNTCRKVAEEISGYLDRGKTDSALLRLRDLITMFSELKYCELFKEEETETILRNDIVQLIAMEVNVQEIEEGAAKPPSIKRMRKVLNEIEAHCADWAGLTKYRIRKGVSNGS
jgi:hypothetical protein